MDFPSTPYFHYFGSVVAYSHFSTSHTAHGFVPSLFLGSFRPVYFLKAHSFISWVYNPLILPLKLNSFSIHLLILFCQCYWASSFFWASKNDHQHQFFQPHVNFLLWSLIQVGYPTPKQNNPIGSLESYLPKHEYTSMSGSLTWKKINK